MGIAAQFSKRLHSELDAHAAWFPVANSFELGDYGMISDGVFNRLGNVREFDVEVTPRKSGSSSLNFASEGTRVVRLVGDAEVNALPDSPIDARLRIEFGGSSSFLAKAGKLTETSIPNVGQVAGKLASAPGFRRGYRVVWTTFTGHDCAVITSRSSNAALELSGKADALKLFDLGTIGAGVTVSSERDVGFSSLGRTGVIGLRLFKLKLLRDAPKFLGPEGADPEAEVEQADPAELADDV